MTVIDPMELANLAGKIKKMYADGKDTKETAEALKLEEKKVKQIMKILGLSAKGGDITLVRRKVTYDSKNDSFKIGNFALDHIENDLGLNSNKCRTYGWRVTKVKKGEFTITVTELEGPAPTEKEAMGDKDHDRFKQERP